MKTKDLHAGMKVKVSRSARRTGPQPWIVVTGNLEDRKMRLQSCCGSGPPIPTPTVIMLRPQAIEMPWSEWEAKVAKQEARQAEVDRDGARQECERAQARHEALLWVERYNEGAAWNHRLSWGGGTMGPPLEMRAEDLKALVTGGGLPTWPSAPECPNGHPWTGKCYARPHRGNEADCAGKRHPSEVADFVSGVLGEGEGEKAERWWIEPMTRDEAIEWLRSRGLHRTTDELKSERDTLMAKCDSLYREHRDDFTDHEYSGWLYQIGEAAEELNRIAAEILESIKRDRANPNPDGVAVERSGNQPHGAKE